MKLRHLSIPQGEVEAEVLLKALAYNLAEMEPKKFGDTVADVET